MDDQGLMEEDRMDLVKDEPNDDGPLIYIILLVAVILSVGFFVSMALYSTMRIEEKDTK
jgi:hypothetical protein